MRKTLLILSAFLLNCYENTYCMRQEISPSEKQRDSTFQELLLQPAESQSKTDIPQITDLMDIFNKHEASEISNIFRNKFKDIQNISAFVNNLINLKNQIVSEKSEISKTEEKISYLKKISSEGKTARFLKQSILFEIKELRDQTYISAKNLAVLYAYVYKIFENMMWTYTMNTMLIPVA